MRGGKLNIKGAFSGLGKSVKKGFKGLAEQFVTGVGTGVASSINGSVDNTTNYTSNDPVSYIPKTCYCPADNNMTSDGQYYLEQCYCPAKSQFQPQPPQYQPYQSQPQQYQPSQYQSQPYQPQSVQYQPDQYQSPSVPKTKRQATQNGINGVNNVNSVNSVKQNTIDDISDVTQKGAGRSRRRQLQRINSGVNVDPAGLVVDAMKFCYNFEGEIDDDDLDLIKEGIMEMDSHGIDFDQEGPMKCLIFGSSKRNERLDNIPGFDKVQQGISRILQRGGTGQRGGGQDLGTLDYGVLYRTTNPAIKGGSVVQMGGADAFKALNYGVPYRTTGGGIHYNGRKERDGQKRKHFGISI